MMDSLLLIYLQNFVPNKLNWANLYSIEKHFELRLANVYGNLFAVLNIIICFLLIQFSKRLTQSIIIS